MSWYCYQNDARETQQTLSSLRSTASSLIIPTKCTVRIKKKYVTVSTIIFEKKKPIFIKRFNIPDFDDSFRYIID